MCKLLRLAFIIDNWAFASFFLAMALGSLDCGAFTRPSDVIVANPVQALIDARALIAKHQGSTNAEPAEHLLLESSELPESLQLPGLRYAYLTSDHLDLILARNPDWNVGARIWSQDSTRQHADKPTGYPGIFFFKHNNDWPESADNLL